MGGKVRPQKQQQTPALLAAFDIADAVTAKWLPQDEVLTLRTHLEWMKAMLPSLSETQIRQMTQEFLTQWNEGAGPAVEEFWQRIAKAGLGYQRKQDIVKAALQAGRIFNEHHYVEIDSHFEQLQACGKISAEEAERLDAILGAFEQDTRTQPMFDDRIDLVAEKSGAPYTISVIPTKTKGAVLNQMSDNTWCLVYATTQHHTWFAEHGLQGGGETWSSVLRALLQANAPHLLACVRINAESDAVTVLSDQCEPLQQLDTWLANAIASEAGLSKLIPPSQSSRYSHI